MSWSLAVAVRHTTVGSRPLRVRPCPGGGQTRIGCENSDAANGTRGYTGAATQHRAVPGHRGIISNISAKLMGLMSRTRWERPVCLIRLRRAWAKIRRQGRFLTHTAFRDALGLPERPLRRNSSA
ncbi:hypothetical protein TRVL_02719 [Trypanosoma vivax]|nr:hypothetical protein TRVL_02719 [Trypanosoma vivax]